MCGGNARMISGPMIRYIICIVFLVLAGTACTQETPYPNVVVEAGAMENGETGLVGWRSAPLASSPSVHRLVPVDAAFDGAVSWGIYTEAQAPKAAALEAVREQGMMRPKVMAQAKADREAVALIESAEEAGIYSVVVDGKLGERPARAILLIWHGNYGEPKGTPPRVGVTGFMAPRGAFEAMGGLAVPAVRMNFVTMRKDADMNLEGDLDPKEAAERLTHLFELWAVYHVEQLADQLALMQTLAIQQRTLSAMQSTANGMADCGGDCDMTIGPDGGLTTD